MATPPSSSPDAPLSPQARAFLDAERKRGGGERATSPMSAYDSAAMLKPSTGQARKSLLLAYVLWWFGPTVAAHRFYLGAFRSALAMLGLFWGGLVIGFVSSGSSETGGGGIPPFWVLMIAGWFIWCIVDAFLIPGLRRRYEQGVGQAGLRDVFA